MAQNSQPVAPKKNKQLTIHNHTRFDDYYWMNERDSKPVLDHLKLENDYTENYFKPLQNMVNGLMKEFDERINPNEVSAPFKLNGKIYQVKNIEGKEVMINQVGCYGINLGRVDFYLSDDAKGYGKAIIVS